MNFKVVGVEVFSDVAHSTGLRVPDKRDKYYYFKLGCVNSERTQATRQNHHHLQTYSNYE